MTFILFATSGLQTSPNIRTRHTFCLLNACHLTVIAFAAIKQSQRQGLDFETPTGPGDDEKGRMRTDEAKERTERNENGCCKLIAGAGRHL